MELVDNFNENKLLNLNFNYFLERLDKKNFFSYSRFNDGELICVIKNFSKDLNILSNYNCDKHEYFPSLGVELLNSLDNSNNENYYIQFLCGFIKQEKFKSYVEILLKNKKLNGEYISCDFLQDMFRTNPNKFKDFIKILNKNEIMIVGPSYLKNINFFKTFDFIEVPFENCYLNKDRILKEIEIKLKKGQIVLFSSSMATNSFIDILFKKYGKQNFFIDAGSIWDIFFHKTNPEIKQRTPNLKNLNKLYENYKDFFI